MNSSTLKARSEAFNKSITDEFTPSQQRGFKVFATFYVNMLCLDTRLDRTTCHSVKFVNDMTVKPKFLKTDEKLFVEL